MKSAYLIIAHGSKDEQSNEAFFSFIENFRKKYPRRHVEGAFLEIAKPNIPTGIEKCIELGSKEIFVIPLMVFPGRHVKEHIPAFIQEAHENHPDVDFHYAGPLSDDPRLVELVGMEKQDIKI